jgi:hypothetical protein
MKIATGFMIIAVLTLGTAAHAAPDPACVKRLEGEHGKLTQQEIQSICAGHGPGAHGTVPAAPPAPAKPVIGKYDLSANKRA